MPGLGRNRLGILVDGIEPAIERDAVFVIRSTLHSQPVGGGRLEPLGDGKLLEGLVDFDETPRQGISRLLEHLPLTGSRAQEDILGLPRI